MRKRIAIIGAGEFQIQLIEKAKEMGYETHVFAWEKGAIGREKADVFYPISITEKEKILEICRKLNLSGVVSIGSDLAVLTVNYVARKLGLYSNPEQVEKVATNKYEMRKAFQKCAVSVPKYLQVSGSADIDKMIKSQRFLYPVIVKPVDRSGSRGICKVDNEKELFEAINRAIQESFSDTAIIEEYIEGEEFSCESISFQGHHEILAFTKKYTTGAPGFIETGHVQPAVLGKEKIVNITEEIRKGLDALHIRNGAAHTEFKLTDDGKVKIIEIGARMGGDCIGSDLVFLSTGYDYLKMVIQASVGIYPELVQVGNKNKVFIKFIFNDEDLKKLEVLKQEIPEAIYKIWIEDIVGSHKVTDSSNRFGYYIVRGDIDKKWEEYALIS